MSYLKVIKRDQPQPVQMFKPGHEPEPLGPCGNGQSVEILDLPTMTFNEGQPQNNYRGQAETVAYDAHGIEILDLPSLNFDEQNRR